MFLLIMSCLEEWHWKTAQRRGPWGTAVLLLLCLFASFFSCVYVIYLWILLGNEQLVPLVPLSAGVRSEVLACQNYIYFSLVFKILKCFQHCALFTLLPSS